MMRCMLAREWTDARGGLAGMQGGVGRFVMPPLQLLKIDREPPLL